MGLARKAGDPWKQARLPRTGTRKHDMQGRRMRRKTLFCLKIFGVSFALWSAGCCTHTSAARSGPDTLSAPRLIHLPTDMRPLTHPDPAEPLEIDGGPVPA